LAQLYPSAGVTKAKSNARVTKEGTTRETEALWPEGRCSLRCIAHKGLAWARIISDKNKMSFFIKNPFLITFSFLNLTIKLYTSSCFLC
jgi:hypothetical protein